MFDKWQLNIYGQCVLDMYVFLINFVYISWNGSNYKLRKKHEKYHNFGWNLHVYEIYLIALCKVQMDT